MREMDRKGDTVGVAVTSISDDNPSLERQLPPRSPGSNSRAKGLLAWTTTGLMVSYFVFSIALYTLLPDGARKGFWFVYLTIATIVAGITAMEAYDGLTPLREARKAVQKASNGDWKYPTAETDLPSIHLIFDAGPKAETEDLDSFSDLAEQLLYPAEKVIITVLRSSAHVGNEPAVDYIGASRPSSVRILSVPAQAAVSRSSRIAYCLALDSTVTSSGITAVFNGDELPHPNAPRHAVEKLLQDAKVDIVQGRSITATSGSLLGSLASLEFDMDSGILSAGHAITWSISRPNGTNAYWRTDALRAAATATAVVPSDGLDLPYAALARGVRTIYDLKVTSYSPCPSGWRQYCGRHVAAARQSAVATVRYSGLAFRRHRPGDQAGTKWTLTNRIGILHSLFLTRFASHAILQYFSMALALLFTRTPDSAYELMKLMYLPYPISTWFIAIGSLCLVATVAMAYMARTEFTLLRTAPLALLLYPLLLVFRAGVDTYGQLDAIVQ